MTMATVAAVPVSTVTSAVAAMGAAGPAAAMATRPTAAAVSTAPTAVRAAAGPTATAVSTAPTAVGAAATATAALRVAAIDAGRKRKCECNCSANEGFFHKIDLAFQLDEWNNETRFVPSHAVPFATTPTHDWISASLLQHNVTPFRTI
jgi:hypothetical protein